MEGRIPTHRLIVAFAALVVFAAAASIDSGANPAQVPAPSPTTAPGAPAPSSTTTPYTPAAPIDSPSPSVAPVAPTVEAPAPPPVLPAPPVRTTARRAGIQAGHWLTFEVPDELSALWGAVGVWDDEWDEAVINHKVAQMVAGILEREGIQVDILSTVVPESYSADLFIALHADAWKEDSSVRGFKVARRSQGGDPELDAALAGLLIADYGAETGIPLNRDTMSENMTEYYAFDYSRYRHAVSPDTPAAIMEMGFLTNDEDRAVLVDRREVAARAIARAALDFLEMRSRAGK